MVRLFICIWIPEDIKNKLILLQKEMKEIGVHGKYVEKDNFHVTLTFIGEVKEDKVGPLKEMLEKCLSDVKGFKIELSGLKLIPNESFIRVIGIKIISEELRNLIREIGSKIGGSFYEEEKVTLCRVKSLKKDKFKMFLVKNINVNLGSFNVKSVCLVKSVLTRDGPIYETIHVVDLK
ncbi:MAG: RNA 2',3'-cyclic phosphodiesterase [Candidatus Aenigmatarchaeota archaeon]